MSDDSLPTLGPTRTAIQGDGVLGEPATREFGFTLIHSPGIGHRRVGDHVVLSDLLEEGAGEVILGRGQDLFGKPLADPEMSKRHLRFGVSKRKGEQTYAVQDCGSTNGTYLIRPVAAQGGAYRTEERLDDQERLLQDGDIIRAGQLFLQFERSELVGGVRRERKVRVGKSLVPFLTASVCMRKLMVQLERVARMKDFFVVLQGETGTGKEYLARLIAAASEREGEYLAYSLATAFADNNVIIDELFGHKKGAFDGAKENRDGLIRRAHGGILFLDEMQEATSSLQALLLRAVDPGRIKPLGYDREFPVDVNLIGAVSTPLSLLIQDGRLRRDFEGRITMSLKVPPLRDRPADVMALTLYHLRKVHACSHDLHAELVSWLLCQRWPKNIRELIASVAHVVEENLEHGGQVLKIPRPRDEDPEPEEASTSPASAPGSRVEDTFARLSKVEKMAQVAMAMRQANGVATQAARNLRISRKTLYKWQNKALEEPGK